MIIVDVVEKSSTINKAQLIGTPQREVLVPTYDWTGHLAPYFRRIKSLKTYHHFTLDSQCPGMVQWRMKVIIIGGAETLNKYRIPGNFRGAKFSRISRFLLFRKIKFREITAMPHPIILHTWIIRENIFREFLFCENLAPRKFPGIRYS